MPASIYCLSLACPQSRLESRLPSKIRDLVPATTWATFAVTFLVTKVPPQASLGARLASGLLFLGTRG